MTTEVELARVVESVKRSLRRPATDAEVITYLVKTGEISAATADAAVGDAPSIADALSTFEGALAAGVPVADLLTAQAARHGAAR